MRLFQTNPFKLDVIQWKIDDNGFATAYKVGDFIDLCAGPHIINTGVIKAIKIMKNSSAYWLG